MDLKSGVRKIGAEPVLDAWEEDSGREEGLSWEATEALRMTLESLISTRPYIGVRS